MQDLGETMGPDGSRRRSRKRGWAVLEGRSYEKGGGPVQMGADYRGRMHTAAVADTASSKAVHLQRLGEADSTALM